MFDISFGELMLIGIIALVVIGPQRLPKVARTLGHLIGRAQRYVNDVKHDIQKEIDLEELNKVKHQMESAARSVQSSVQDVGNSLTQPVEEARAAVADASRAIQDSVKLQASATTNATDAATASAAPSPEPAPAADNPKQEPPT